MPEPSLSEVHSDLVGRLEHDKRLRAVEQAQAATDATIGGLTREVHAQRTDSKEDKAEIMGLLDVIRQEIRANKPEPPWRAMAALAGLVTVVFLVAGAIYTGATP